ncbi:MAG: 2-amino-4-hydroxy-6-hydroxymethyldihydropteridine diphosphokinase [Ignavibacteriaceae bacterium]|nr:2-amino-4-hydroxy-6-hydroxymethyldihydropteridine diphosphokinase [Ignavibacteriaceae bacterium]
MNSNSGNIAFIGLGSNKGDRLNYLQSSLIKLSSIKNIKIVSVSSVYETKPLGISTQDNFYNAAAKLETDLDAEKLFEKLKEIEVELGRTFTEKWGPREIDLDLLLYNHLIFSNDFISLPHKGIIYRDFVLQPLFELEPELVHPELNKKLSIILLELEEKFVVKIIPEKLFIPGQNN